jgi:hypothetical protein
MVKEHKDALPDRSFGPFRIALALVLAIGVYLASLFVLGLFDNGIDDNAGGKTKIPSITAPST